MRVTIDFDEPTGGHWAGSIHAGDDGEAVDFDGRLQLLRLLEAAVERTEPFTTTL